MNKKNSGETFWDVLQFMGYLMAGVVVVVIIAAYQSNKQKIWNSTHTTVGGITIMTDPQTGCRFIENSGLFSVWYTQIRDSDGKPDCVR
jgi:hypothetical protein